MTDNIIKIFTDGALSKSHKKASTGTGGAAYVAINSSGEIIHQLSEQDWDVTCQNMEVRAIWGALNYASSLKEEVVIYSDSQYCVKGINEWMGGWYRRGWMKKDNHHEYIPNHMLWKMIHAMWSKLDGRVTVKKVKGHSNNKWNDYVDDLAVKAKKGILAPRVEKKKTPRIKPKQHLRNTERLFDKKDLVALDYPKSSYNRFKLEDVTQIWLCISKINKFLSMEFTSADIRILKEGRPICKSELDKSITRTMHDVLWKYFKRHFVIDLIER